MLVRCVFGSTLLTNARIAWLAGFCIIGIPPIAVVAQSGPAQAQRCALVWTPTFSITPALIWLPTATEGTNPFTEYMATVLDVDVRANTPSMALGASVTAPQPAVTRRWLGLSAYVADLYSAAARPRVRSAFTHKLDLGLRASSAVFNWTPKRSWVHNVTGTAILDYVATGFPHAGDELPAGERLFVTGAPRAMLTSGRLIPIAPSVPE